MIDGPRFSGTTPPDIDPTETGEWLDALDAVLQIEGGERAQFLLQQLEERLRDSERVPLLQPFSAYRNSIPLEDQGAYPGDLDIEARLTAILRWNALAMVIRANQAQGGLGGHIASYASAAEIFEVGFNHFFHARDDRHGGDLVFFQPHSAPGVYARAFLEGRLSEEQLGNYRRELGGQGLSSYPHPWLMPDFWQFPTGSMGIGPINAVYQARFLRYLEDRGLAETTDRHVWGVFGDGEMDEPEAIAGLTLAAREGLDNLTFIINCNLQRLDGPVRGNGQIIRELESLFTGAGWNVIKVLWGSEWDSIFARDTEHLLLRFFAATPDGKYQTLGAKDGAYNLANFFQQDPALAELVSHMSAEEIDGLRRGGHDPRKLYPAFAASRAGNGRPTVILAKTKKGFGMGNAGESRNTSHQTKTLDIDALKAFRDRFGLPLTDQQVANLAFYKPPEDSREMRYLQERRQMLGGYLPRRLPEASPLRVPPIESYAGFALEAEEKARSTTMYLVRMLGNLLKDKTLGPRIVPIVADEARTFGMTNLFRQVGIYAPRGQLYEPEDAGSLLSYRESTDGQLLEEGITEAGALSSWVAAATSYSVNGLAMLPFYIYYSMFGFQRVGDLIWAAADQRARGFLLGATAGRTTLNGEGLQHQDGSSHLVASTVPNCRAYDPAFGYEVAAIVDYGARRMLEQQVDEFYYITLSNEGYAQPKPPENINADIISGLYYLQTSAAGEDAPRVRLLGSGPILLEVIKAGELLAAEWGVTAEVFSATSYSELARDARRAERAHRLQTASADEQSHIEQLLPGDTPVIAVSDYVCAWPQLIVPYLECRVSVLGTDGFGRSDTRAGLRQFFEVDSKSVTISALSSLVREGALEKSSLIEALARYDIDAEAAAPWAR